MMSLDYRTEFLLEHESADKVAQNLIFASTYSAVSLYRLFLWSVMWIISLSIDAVSTGHTPWKDELVFTNPNRLFGLWNSFHFIKLSIMPYRTGHLTPSCLGTNRPVPLFMQDSSSGR